MTRKVYTIHRTNVPEKDAASVKSIALNKITLLSLTEDWKTAKIIEQCEERQKSHCSDSSP